MKLLVLIHGWLLTGKALHPLKSIMESDDDFMGYRIEIFSYDARKFSNQRLENVGLVLDAYLNKLCQDSSIKEVLLVGHSIGGLVARKAYLLSLNRKSNWSALLSKLVLLGTPNRGSTIDQYSIFERAWMLLMDVTNQMRLIRDAFRGSAFITNLRLDWVREFRRREDDAGENVLSPFVIQVICKRDFRVKPEDSLDVIQFGNADYVEVDNESHESIIQVNNPEQHKYKAIKDAILQQRSPISGHVYRGRTDQIIRNVTIFMHGIRTDAKWTRKAAAIFQQNRNDVEVLWPSYGFFSLAKFLWGPSRHTRVLWFRDVYANAVVEHPLAQFNYVGHSNGTYILANALEEFESIKFNRVYFAGSVVPADYPWQRYFESGRLQYLRNDCASVDLPVGFLCNALNRLGVNRLGVGGYAGFSAKSERMIQNKFLDVNAFDGHSVALNDANFVTIRNFILEDIPDIYGTPSINRVDRPPFFMRHLYNHALLYFIGLLFLLLLPGALLVQHPIWLLIYLMVILYILLWF